MILRVQPGRHSPCLHGCLLRVEATGLVSIEGPSRERVFEQAARFIRVHAKGLPPQAIAAVLQTPPAYAPPGRDGWSIIVGADVSFSPTAIEPHLPRPELTVLAAG